MNKYIFKIFFFITLYVLGSCKNLNSDETPNIVLIVADDLGWSDVSYMGSSFYETSNIDKLSLNGMTFLNGYASSANCAPSRATMLTGKYHPHHGIYTVRNSDRGNTKTRKIIPIKTKTKLEHNHFIISEMLKSKGYVNGHFGKWHMGPLGYYPENMGFDINVGGNESGGPGSYFPPYRNVNKNLKVDPKEEYLTDRLGTEVVNFIEKNKDNKFFAYVPFYSVHTPIQAKPEYESKYKTKKSDDFHNRADYAGMIQSLDENIGKILNKIKELNLENNTLIIFTSDNGGIRSISNQHPLRAGKGSYYEGGIRVPLIISWPGKIKPGSTSYERVSNIDFFPTIKKIVGYEEKLDLDGMDLTNIFKEKQLKKRSLFFHFPVYLEPYDVLKDNGTDPLFRTRPGSVLIKGDWKLHKYYENNKIELYNLKNDISESNNLSKINKEKTTELLNELEAWLIEKNAPIPSEPNLLFSQKYNDSLINLIKKNKLSGRVNKNEKTSDLNPF